MDSRRTLNRREFLRMSALTMTGVALAACAPAAPEVTEAPAEEPEEAPVEEVSVEPVTINMIGFPFATPPDKEQGVWEQEMAAEYMDMHPEVTIDYQMVGWDAIPKVVAMLTAANPPDVLLQAAISHILYALDSDVAVPVELPQEYIDDLPAGWYEKALYQGQNYFFPFFLIHNDWMMVNLDIVEEVGAEDLLPGEDGWDFEQYTELMRACTFERDDGTKVWGMIFPTQLTNPYFHHPEQVMSWNWGADTVEYAGGNWRCKMGDDDSISWLRWLQDLAFVDEVIPDPSGLTISREEFWQQNAAATMWGGNVRRTQDPNVEVDPETLHVYDSRYDHNWYMPQNPIGPGATEPACWGGPKLDCNLMVFKGREDPANVVPASIDYCLWFTNEKNQKDMAPWYVPIRMSAIATIETPVLKWFADNVFQYGRQRASADGARARETVEALEILLQQIFLPGEDVSQAADEFCAVVDALDWGVIEVAE